MNTQSANPQEYFELRIRTMRTLWVALFMSVGLYYVFTFFVGRSEDIEPNAMLSLILIAIAISAMLISFPIKNRLLAQAIEQQQVQLVQQAYVVAWALTEVAGILGMLDYFLTGNRYYYVLFIIAAFGQLLHFPRREHVINAWSKTPIV